MAARAASTDLDERDEEELLLIVAGLGMPQDGESGEQEYWVGEEAHDCISDLQRYLRRDDPNVMAAPRAVGGWRVLQTHLLPILCSRSSDSKLVFNVLKVVVKITMKPEQLGTRMIDAIKEKKVPDPLVGKQLKELEGHHRAYKRAFVQPHNVGMLVRLLAKPLSTPEESRSEEDSMVIELLLALLLNLLHTEPPDAPPPAAAAASVGRRPAGTAEP